MKLINLINEIMGDLNFNELEKREIENGCDFKGTLDHYRSIVKDSIKEMSCEDICDKLKLLILSIILTK